MGSGIPAYITGISNAVKDLGPEYQPVAFLGFQNLCDILGDCGFEFASFQIEALKFLIQRFKLLLEILVTIENYVTS